MVKLQLWDTAGMPCDSCLCSCDDKAASNIGQGFEGHPTTGEFANTPNIFKIWQLLVLVCISSFQKLRNDLFYATAVPEVFRDNFV